MSAVGRRVGSVPATPVVIGIVLVAALNGLPGANLQHVNVHGSFAYTDVCYLVLIAVAAKRRLSTTRPASSPLLRSYQWWGLLLFAVWLIAFREAVGYGTSSFHAALFGRDFLYFAVLAPLAPWLVSDERELATLLTTLAVLTTLYIIILLPAELGVTGTGALNATNTYKQNGLVRIYSSMGDANLIDLVFCGMLAYAVLARGVKARIAAVVAGLCLIAMLLLQTRALYLGIAVALVVVSLLWGTAGPAAANIRRRIGTTAVIVILLTGVITVADPSFFNSGAVAAVGNRIATGVTSATKNSGTVAIRSDDADVMLRALDGRWLLGLGFRDPSSFYVVGLPGGDLEDSDVGALNSVVTMGIVGSVILFLPLGVAIVALFRRRKVQSPYAFLYLGGSLWCVSAAASSVTLGAFESTAGIINACVALGVVLRAMSWDSLPHEAAEAPATWLPGRHASPVTR